MSYSIQQESENLANMLEVRSKLDKNLIRLSLELAFNAGQQNNLTELNKMGGDDEQDAKLHSA